MPSSKREEYYFSLSQDEFEKVKHEIFNDDTKQNDPYLEQLMGQYTQEELLAFNLEQQLELLNTLMKRYYFQLSVKLETDNETYEVGLRQFNINKKVRSLRKVTWRDLVVVYLPYITGLIHFYHRELHRPENTLVSWDINRNILINHIKSLDKKELGEFVVAYNRYWDVFYKAFRIPEINQYRIIKIHDKYAGYINQRIGKQGKRHELTRDNLKKVCFMIGQQYSGILMQTRGPRLRPSEMQRYQDRDKIINYVGKSDPYL